MYKYLFKIALIGLLLTLSGCIPDQLVSWSSDGRYILYTGLEIKGLWVWDSKTDKVDEIKLRIRKSDSSSSETESLKKELLGCSYLSDTSKALIKTEDDKLFLLDVKSGLCDLLDRNVEPGYNISRDGKQIYYVKVNTLGEKDKEYTLLEYKNGKKTPIFTSKDEFFCPSISPDGNYILYSTEHSLSLYDLKAKKSVVFISDQKRDYYFTKWVNENEIVYIQENNSNNSYSLYKLSVDLVNKKPASEPRILKKGIYPAQFFLTNYTHEAQALEKDKSSTVSKITEPVIIATLGEDEKDLPKAAIISIKTGNILWESDTASSAMAPALSPDGKHLAYLSGFGNDYIYLEIQNLKSGKRTIAWRNDVEELFAAAEDLKQVGEFQKALDMYHTIIKQFPESGILKTVYNNMAMLPLKLQVFDLDAAYDAINLFGTFDNLPLKLRESLWRPEDRIAIDPPEDWTQTYGTEKSKNKFKFNTDLTRDLRELWMREGKDWLYIRIDYGSDRDLTGLTFQDTLLLFDYDTPEIGSRSISDLVQWDKTADRKILIRHWFEAQASSQYDLETLNEKDEVIHKYLVSGFAPPGDPLFKYYKSGNRGSNSIIYAISRSHNLFSYDNMFKLKSGTKINIQVCTFKGGIESHRKLETPRFDPTKNLCDVADTFGKENNIERIKADKAANPNKPVVIKGYAGTLELTQ